MKMCIYKKKVYNRVLIKLSGESLQNEKKTGINQFFLYRIAKDIKEIVQLGIQVSIVIGGGNLFRGSSLTNIGVNHIVADHIGMLATIINGLAIRDILFQKKVQSYLMSSFSIKGMCSSFNLDKARKLLSSNIVIIFGGGTGNPCFTTDSAACLRAIETKSEIVLKGTNVNGVYSADPKKKLNAIMYHKLSYKEVLDKELKIMDLSAFILARDYKIPICVFNINTPGLLYKIVTGVQEGTFIGY